MNPLNLVLMIQRIGNMFASNALSSLVYIYIVAWLQVMMIGGLGNSISGSIMLFLAPVDVVTMFVKIWMSILFDGGTQIATWVKILFSIMIPFIIIDIIMSLFRSLIWLALSPFRLMIATFYKIRNENKCEKDNHTKSENLKMLKENNLKKDYDKREADEIKIHKEHLKMKKKRIKEQKRILSQQKKEKKLKEKLEKEKLEKEIYHDNPEDAQLSNKKFTSHKEDVIYVNGKPRKIK